MGKSMLTWKQLKVSVIVVNKKYNHYLFLMSNFSLFAAIFLTVSQWMTDTQNLSATLIRLKFAD